MSPLERHCGWLVFAYPPAYRRARGEEIRSTLLEVSRPGSAWPPSSEMAAVLAAGGRRRLALADDQPLGALAGMLAGWYLAIAVAMAASALLFGEWAPWSPQRLRTPYGFGPFTTDAVPLYAVILAAGVAGGARRRRLSRALAAGALALTGVMLLVEHHTSSWGRPPLSFVVPMVACLIPTVLRSPFGRRRPDAEDRFLRIVTVAVTVGFPVWLAVIDVHLDLKYRTGDYSWTGTGVQFYRETIGSLARWMPSVGLVVLIAVVALIVAHRRPLAEGLVCLTGPWLVLSVLVQGSPSAGGTLSGSTPVAVATRASAALVVVAFVAVATWLIATREKRSISAAG